ncbi:MAG: transketolase [Bacteroides sp.]|nr:transketolase [Ruminococcus flavefaciens]MCM1554824.1 transketolase [Bacteroides sp.]
MRTAFIQQLIEEREINDKIFLIVGDLGYNVVNTFAERFPSSYLNAGIAEQNMMGVAAAMAAEGYIVYVYSIGNFPTLRCMEQIRNDVAYNNLNVRIVSVGAGFAYGSLGASHHATEDIAMMTAIPNMAVCSPGDPAEAKRITEISVRHQGPMYLRIGKAGEKNVHGESVRLDFELGDILPVGTSKAADTTAVLTTGSILYSAWEAISGNNLQYALYSVPSIKPIDKDQLIRIADRYNEIVTLEEHQLNGGLGSLIASSVSDLYSEGKISRFPRIKRIGVDDKFIYKVGSQHSIQLREGLTL